MRRVRMRTYLVIGMVTNPKSVSVKFVIAELLSEPLVHVTAELFHHFGEKAIGHKPVRKLGPERAPILGKPVQPGRRERQDEPLLVHAFGHSASFRQADERG